MTKKHKKQEPRRRVRRPQVPARQERAIEYPIGTVAYYGPDDKTITKMVTGVVMGENTEPIIRRWRGPGVAADPAVKAESMAFLASYGVREVAITDGVLGCPHEEGIDFPEGQECPFCPFWHGKQGIHVRET